MHLDEEQVQRLMHRQLPPAAEASLREHLTACDSCRGQVAAAERDEAEVYALLRLVDHSPPRVDPREIAAAAGSARFVWGRRAAGILLALSAATVAYAAPGSPLPGWIREISARIGSGQEQTPVAPPVLPVPEAELGGIAVAPGQALVIQFTSHQADGQARVSLRDISEVVVRAPSGAATFSSDVDRLVIDNAGSTATFKIEIPRTAPRVEIRVSADRIFLKDSLRIEHRWGTEAGGIYLLPLRPRRE